jgi:hypothetical protein
MRVDQPIAGVAILAIVATAQAGMAAESFRKLAAPQIRAALAGMELSDDVHSRDVFEPNGKLVSFAMSSKSIGAWRVQNDELCFDRPKQEPSCYEFWMSGKKVELRRKGLAMPLFEGVLRRPTGRP